MQEYLDFAQRHTLIVGAFFVILAMIIWMELRRFTRGYQDVTPQAAVRLMNDDEPLVVDVRETGEVVEGRIKGARHIPLSAFKQRLGELDKYKGKKSVIAYCRSGARSHSACNMLKKHGFETVYNLKGGIMSWQSEKLPVSNK